MISAARSYKASSAARTRSRSSTAICNSPTRSGTASSLMSPTACARLGSRAATGCSSCLQNRWEMATLHWACQFAGIVIVPLNWRAKPEELDYCVTDAGVKAIVYEPVCADAVRKSCAAQNVPRIGLDDAPGRTTSFDALLGRTRANAGETTHASADDLSLILYTSGTTGKAKGVPRRHRHERAARSRMSRKTSTGTASARSA